MTKSIRLLVLLAFATAFVSLASGQTNTFSSSGNAGIGTETPSFKLDVNGTLSSNGLFTSDGAVHVRPQNATDEGVHLQLLDGSSSQNHWNIDHYNGDLRIFSENGGFAHFFHADGNVGIGASSQNYKLSSHIVAEGRLLGAPSAAEVREAGLPVGEAQTLMMQKIEELTLYLLEANDAIKELRRENHELRSHLAHIESRFGVTIPANRQQEQNEKFHSKRALRTLRMAVSPPTRSILSMDS